MGGQADRVATFRDLHASGCFVIPNPWDNLTYQPEDKGDGNRAQHKCHDRSRTHGINLPFWAVLRERS